MKNIAVIFVALLMILPTSAIANKDAGLYDPVVPDDSALVRFVYLNQDEDVKISANGKSYESIAADGVSPYYIVKAGNANLKIHGAELNDPIDEGKAYTLVKYEHSEFFLEDFINDNKAKSQLALYNFTGKDDLTLKVIIGGTKKIDAVKKVADKHVGFRLLNPLKVGMAVFKDDKQVGEKFDVVMERDRTYSFFASKKSVFMVVSTTDTTK